LNFPFSISRICGGASSGAAVCVGSSVVDFAIGKDLVSHSSTAKDLNLNFLFPVCNSQKFWHFSKNLLYFCITKVKLAKKDDWPEER
jgi:hypothetical protein